MSATGILQPVGHQPTDADWTPNTVVMIETGATRVNTYPMSVNLAEADLAQAFGSTYLAEQFVLDLPQLSDPDDHDISYRLLAVKDTSMGDYTMTFRIQCQYDREGEWITAELPPVSATLDMAKYTKDDAGRLALMAYGACTALAEMFRRERAERRAADRELTAA